MIHLVTDSTAYLTTEQMERYNVTVLPLKILVGDQCYDETQLDNQQLLDLMAKQSATSSQPSAGQLLAVFEDKLRDDGHVIAVFLSSGLSGTLNTAKKMAEMTGHSDRIAIFDPESVGIGEEMVVIHAGEMIRQGKSFAEITAVLREHAASVRTLFVPATLDYLRRGGRIGGAQAVLGTILQIKPVVEVRDGVVQLLDKVRTLPRAYARMVAELPPDLERYEVWVGHIMNEAGAQKVRSMILERCPSAQVGIRTFGPVITYHVGPGVVGILYSRKY